MVSTSNPWTVERLKATAAKVGLVPCLNVETYHLGVSAKETTIRKWGNSPAVQQAAAVLREAEFGVEQRAQSFLTA